MMLGKTLETMNHCRTYQEEKPIFIQNALEAKLVMMLGEDAWDNESLPDIPGRETHIYSECLG